MTNALRVLHQKSWAESVRFEQSQKKLMCLKESEVDLSTLLVLLFIAQQVS